MPRAFHTFAIELPFGKRAPRCAPFGFLFTDTALLVAFLNAFRFRFCFEVYCSLLPCAMNQFPRSVCPPRGSNYSNAFGRATRFIRW